MQAKTGRFQGRNGGNPVTWIEGRARLEGGVFGQAGLVTASGLLLKHDLIVSEGDFVADLHLVEEPIGVAL